MKLRQPDLSSLRSSAHKLGAKAKRITGAARRLIAERTGTEGVPSQIPQDVGGRDVAPRTDWRLRAWDDPALERRWLDEGVIAISDDELGDLSDWPGDGELRRRLEEALEERGDVRKPQAYGTFVRYWRSFRLDMAPGDRVAVPLAGRRVGVAEIIGPYEYRADEPEPKMRHVRPVGWLAQCDRADLPEALRRVVNAPGTICEIKEANLDDFHRDAPEEGEVGTTTAR